MQNITEAQIYLTRHCNLKCGYCKLVRDDMPELDLTSWKMAYDNLERIGIKTVKLMGGEPTLQNWLPDLLSYSLQKHIKTAVLSNSSFSDETLDKLVHAGLWGYFASVDSVNIIKNISNDTLHKSHNGYKMLHKLKVRGVPLLVANVVIQKTNLHEILEIGQRLSEEGFYINLCPIQHTTDEHKGYSKTTISNEFRFFEEDRNALEQLAEELIALKQNGIKISVPESYLRNIPRYGINCDWHCTELVQLRIDADGALMLCNEYRTKLADIYNITTLTPKDYLHFVQDWKSVRDSINCDGCYWSCFLQAENNLKYGKLEFHFFEG